jgi:hypothetical protein
MFNRKRPLAVAIAATSLFTAAVASAGDAALTTQIVDTFYKIYGTHPGFRVNTQKAWLRRAALLPRLQRRG